MSVLQADCKQFVRARSHIGELESALAEAEDREHAQQTESRRVKAQLADALFELDSAQQIAQTARSCVACLKSPSALAAVGEHVVCMDVTERVVMCPAAINENHLRRERRCT
jgi:chaperone required for assembly of F1-ATPase